MQPTVVFILSTNYAGSHLLTQLLGAHSQCLSIGELHNFHKLRTRNRSDRNVVNDYENSPMFAGLADRPEAQWHRSILANLRPYRPAAHVLIDNSKRPEWAAQFESNPDFTSRYVHLIRDPRALVRRWQLTYANGVQQRGQRRRLARRKPAWALRALFSRMEVVYALKWLLANQAITGLMQRQGSTTVVSYDDLATDPRSTLQRIMPTLGLTFEPGQLDYGRVAQSGTLKRDYLDAAARSIIAPDRRWQRELSTTVAHRVGELAEMRSYIHGLGLHLDAEGLWDSRPAVNTLD